MRRIVWAVVLACGCRPAARARPGDDAGPAPPTGVATAARDATGRHEDRALPAVAPPVLRLEVAIDGAPMTWAADAFARVPPATANNRGGDARDVWSLRALATTLVGPGARVVAVGAAGQTVAITADAWADPARTPILHTTRRGTLKFRWADARGAWATALVDDVTRLELVR